ncbi:sulfite exporter TauE/SafE family protein [Amorphus orientalis]|uniref:Probable membrane transporter protein n=1 Tax=Amorphus orientalis TaxID=649198 RepID=A0AAE4AUE9_9HYPH|nr:sulfite exporter TauE/SafE family protein [Amorphus orientalis]MDQ0317067.1 putative membrane protein YfcA [Amorphus orientalis]
MFADTPYTLFVIAVLLLLYLAGGFVKGAASFGQPMVTISLGVLFIPVPAAIAIAIVPAFLSNAVQAWGSWRAVSQLKPYAIFYLALVVGVVIGLSIFALLNQDALRAAIGCLLVVFALTQLLGVSPPLTPPPHRGVLAVTGLVSGVCAGTTSFVGFPSLPVLIAYRLDRALFALVTSIMFFITMSMLGGGLTLLGHFGPAELVVGILCCVPSFFGQRIGLRVRDRMSVIALRRLINVVLAAVGLVLAMRGLGIA